MENCTMLYYTTYRMVLHYIWLCFILYYILLYYEEFSEIILYITLFQKSCPNILQHNTTDNLHHFGNV